MGNSEPLQVSVVHSPASRVVRELVLELPVGSTVGQALQASGWLEASESFDRQTLVVGVWGRRAGMNQVLRSNDRVEIYRPLAVDPKLARRLRFEKQGPGVAGLFVKKKSVRPSPISHD